MPVVTMVVVVVAVLGVSFGEPEAIVGIRVIITNSTNEMAYLEKLRITLFSFGDRNKQTRREDRRAWLYYGIMTVKVNPSAQNHTAYTQFTLSKHSTWTAGRGKGGTP